MKDRGQLRVKEGIVVSKKADKTAVVAVERLFVHELYGKAVKRLKRFNCHDEENKTHEGDKVLIAETRPVSKTKRWRVLKITGHKRLKKEKENDTGTN